MRLIPVLAAALLALVGTSPVDAQSLPVPTGPVILTVSGQIAHTNSPEGAAFDREMLMALGMVDVVTHTPWYAGVTTFSGVSFKKLLDHVGAEGTLVRALALNDYETAIPFADAEDPNVILAMELNGEVMEVRDKGPIFVIYPYDSDPSYQKQTYYGRSAWQVTRLVIE